jgi:hypothetical protein
MKKILRAPKLAVLLSALTVAGVGAAVAFATIPDRNGVAPTGAAGPADSLGLVIVWAETEFNSTTPKMKAVDCPTGKKLTGGGARIVLGDGAQGQVEITDSSPTEVLIAGVNVVSETQWHARGDSFPSTAAWRVRAYAICAGPADSLGLVTVWDETEFNSEDTSKTKAVDCPTGKKLTGGGARIVLGPGAEGQAEITDSSPTEILVGGVNVVSETQWFARADSLPISTADWRLRVYAICADTTP